ncbi:hypothetical protein F441_13251 [Phytophthora nicotianae CJ01A1]|uniref:Uncharacterized protein n=5 Tax=Phytophthora nicotianae TaxID=4792 RepID=W2R4L8_PHYN3|nr:hypothetical protein PPTG_21269 [Phytophthora nicotianae INRA-310]ETI41466.1 hypothetical protein F443_13303 [Phytophthora nicotianae P1569]ETK81533.1 hypothetical protein L915_12996 [Phytophthora nicotianae]ETO70137.1 hypothetical protein F444_13378 [Phytophthora nicotianae P1976]ETP11242.1 hypothetical protein F441_13251 [Phytophthora nicotianae CJ01A1]ETL34946.1 hypothetical protein L916_12899 [Phytophthora nicotianae]
MISTTGRRRMLKRALGSGIVNVKRFDVLVERCNPAVVLNMGGNFDLGVIRALRTKWGRHVSQMAASDGQRLQFPAWSRDQRFMFDSNRCRRTAHWSKLDMSPPLTIIDDFPDPRLLQPRFGRAVSASGWCQIVV